MSCTADGCTNEKILALGLCQPCYWRQRRRGTTARKNVVNRGACTAEGCDRQSFSKNLCLKHYQQRQHPLKGVWKLLRSRAPGAYPPAWEAFEVFLEQVGERPSDKHQLRRPDPEIPWSIENMVWREPIKGKFAGTTAEKRAYQRAWHYRKQYGITVEDFDRMWAEQGGLCAVGGEDLTTTAKVCVDHDHITRKVRGILCDACNKGLGAFDDNLTRLRGAIAYLEAHAAPADESATV